MSNPPPQFPAPSRTRTRTGTGTRTRTIYLTIYNTTFCLLWLSTLLSTLHTIFSSSPSSSSSSSKAKTATPFSTTEPLARAIQTLSIIDILHAATRLIPAPLRSTFTQTATRVIQVWLIWYAFPASTAAATWAFPALLLAWSSADAIRYVYLALNLHGAAPAWLTWVRYSMFVVLYPVGIGAEWWLMFRAAVGPAGSVGAWLPPVFYFLLALYVPGAYSMFTYMIKQRRKTLAKSRME